MHSKTAFVEIIKENEGLIYKVTRLYTNSREDAEEITSEAFIKVFEKIASFRGECPFRGWLFGITRNLCIDRLRQPRLLLIDPEEVPAYGDRGRQASSMETSMLVHSILDQMEEHHRMALLLCDIEQWDAREAAQMMGKSVVATKSLLYRARRALRARLTELWDEEETNDDAL